MAVVFEMERDGKKKDGLLGFSWTSLFFGFFVPLIRKDIPAFVGYLIFYVGSNIFLSIITINDRTGGMTLAVALIVLTAGLTWCFKYNKMYTTSLLRDGWRPVYAEGRDLLIEAGLGDYVADMEEEDDEYEYIEVEEGDDEYEYVEVEEDETE